MRPSSIVSSSASDVGVSAGTSTLKNAGQQVSGESIFRRPTVASFRIVARTCRDFTHDMPLCEAPTAENTASVVKLFNAYDRPIVSIRPRDRRARSVAGARRSPLLPGKRTRQRPELDADRRQPFQVGGQPVRELLVRPTLRRRPGHLGVGAGPREQHVVDPPGVRHVLPPHLALGAEDLVVHLRGQAGQRLERVRLLERQVATDRVRLGRVVAGVVVEVGVGDRGT